MDYWLDNTPCTTYGFCRTNGGNFEERYKYLLQFDKWNCNVFPFIHGCVAIDKPWWDQKKNGYPLDPLLVPILDHFYSIDVKTITSCQGYARFGPNVEFVGDLAAAKKVEDLLMGCRGFTKPIIALTGVRKEETSWHLWLYDTLSLIQINRDVLKISIKEQVRMFSDGFVAKHAPAFANPDEIEAIIK